MSKRIRVNGVLYEAVGVNGKYTEKWWDGLSDRERHGIADAIEVSNITADLLEKHIDDLYDALVPWLRQIHVTVADFDYSAADPWAECNLDWDDDWYLAQASKGKVPYPKGSSAHDFVLAGVEDAWSVDIDSELEDAVKDFHDVARKADPDSSEYRNARDEFLDALNYCMVNLADRIESEVLGLFAYYYDDVEVEAIPHFIEDGVFDEVIDKYLATHGIDESYSHCNRAKSKRNRRSRR